MSNADVIISVDMVTAVTCLSVDVSFLSVANVLICIAPIEVDVEAWTVRYTFSQQADTVVCLSSHPYRGNGRRSRCGSEET